MTVYYAVGDIHGCYFQFKTLMGKIFTDICEGEQAEVVFVGDYIDRGPQSKEVIDYIRGLPSERPDIKFVPLKGNHEWLCLTGFGWIINGGQTTLDSFGGFVPYEYKEWMHLLPCHYETKKYIFVHAGLVPGKTPDECDEETKLWIRDGFLESEFNWGKIVIHGHTPTEDNLPWVRDNAIDIDTGAVFGGPLTAVVLREGQEPKFLQANHL